MHFSKPACSRKSIFLSKKLSGSIIKGWTGHLQQDVCLVRGKLMLRSRLSIFSPKYFSCVLIICLTNRNLIFNRGGCETLWKVLCTEIQKKQSKKCKYKYEIIISRKNIVYNFSTEKSPKVACSLMALILNGAHKFSLWFERVFIASSFYCCM